MHDSIEWLRLFISAHKSIEYLIVFFGVALGGELALFTLAFLVAQKVVSAAPFVIFSFLGTFFSNTLWFLIGKTSLVTKIASYRYFNTTISSMTEAITRISKENRFVALFIIKFLVGTFLTLILYANRTGLKWRDFLYYEFIIVCIWLVFYIPIGYFSGIGFIYLAGLFNNLYAAIGFVLLVILVIMTIQIRIEKIFTEKV